MPLNIDQIIRNLSSAARKRVEDRAAEIIVEELSVRDVRKLRKRSHRPDGA